MVFRTKSTVRPHPGLDAVPYAYAHNSITWGGESLHVRASTRRPFFASGRLRSGRRGGQLYPTVPRCQHTFSLLLLEWSSRRRVRKEGGESAPSGNHLVLPTRCTLAAEFRGPRTRTLCAARDRVPPSLRSPCVVDLPCGARGRPPTHAKLGLTQKYKA